MTSLPHGVRFPDLLIYRGYSAPVRIEADVYDLEFDGELPESLSGTYYRNSADPRYPPLHGTDIFLNGDGMVHMVRFDAGGVDLKTRYVRTPKFLAERKARRALVGHYRNPFTDDPSALGLDRGTANTSVSWHAGRLLALKEDSRPTRIDPDTLETLGSFDFDGALTSKTFTAHPKLDPDTGEMFAFAYNTEGVASTTIAIYWISATGELTRTETFEAPYPSMVHGYSVSKNYFAFTICPMVNDWERVKNGEPFFHWDSRLPTQVAVIPRSEGVAGLRWFAHPTPVMQTHTFNAWDEAGWLHLDHFITGTGWLSQFPDINDPDNHEQPPFAQRWSFDFNSDRTGELNSDPSSGMRSDFDVAPIFNQFGEMPVVDPRFAMHRTRHFFFGTFNPALGPMLEWGPKGPPFTCIGHFDELTQTMSYWYAGPESAPEEPCFVPKSPDAEEGDGWLLTMVGRRTENRTDLVVLDALDLAAGPVAVIRIPCRLHEGFHGIWVPAS